MEIIASGLIAAFAVLLSQLIAALAPRWNIKSEVGKQDSIESSQKRRQVYEEFTTTIFNNLDGTKKTGEFDSRTSRELQKTFKNFRGKILLVGSDRVVRSFNNWNIYSEREQSLESGQELLAAVADMIVAMRRDLGYPKTNLKRIEILAVFLNDAETAEEAMAKPLPSRFENTKSL